MLFLFVHGNVGKTGDQEEQLLMLGQLGKASFLQEVLKALLWQLLWACFPGTNDNSGRGQFKLHITEVE